MIGIGECCLGSGELGLALVDRSVERLTFDCENHLALFDVVAVLEQAPAEKALHARPKIDLFERLGPPDELGLFSHRPEFRRLNEDRRGSRSWLLARRDLGRGRKHSESEKEVTRSHFTPRVAPALTPARRRSHSESCRQGPAAFDVYSLCIG